MGGTEKRVASVEREAERRALGSDDVPEETCFDRCFRRLDCWELGSICDALLLHDQGKPIPDDLNLAADKAYNAIFDRATEEERVLLRAELEGDGTS